MTKVFVFDATKCNGCYNCQLGCKDENVNNAWLPYALPQPDVGHFWLKLEETTHGQTPKVKMEYTPKVCNHCDDAPCIKAYPDAIYKRDDGLVIIDPEKAKGHKDIADACPWGYIYWNDELEVAQKCTGCAHLVDEGLAPHCVDLCFSEALRFGDKEDFADELADAEYFVDENVGPNVYYINMPHLFIGGDVWDEAADEIIEGAEVSLSGNGVELSTTTDDFGDFWFKRLMPGTYTLKVKADGYQDVPERTIELTESLNVGDFPLVK